MSIELPALPYSLDALQPHISARTLEYHHGKHHRTYVDKLNLAIENTDYADMALVDIIMRSHKTGEAGVFNNAAQIWNHTFLWHSMSAKGGGDAEGPLKEAIDQQFGSISGFGKAFKDAAMGQFGSGWTWLVVDGGNLKVVSSGNAGTPLTDGQKPLLTLDVWEHAYYLDYQNDRGKYVDTFLEHLINWEFAASNYSKLG
ncbi:MAG TPA: superoxide dismutase [Xanthomonadales bacterium]